jgi:methyl-accepting chemotaxis protein
MPTSANKDLASLIEDLSNLDTTSQLEEFGPQEFQSLLRDLENAGRAAEALERHVRGLNAQLDALLSTQIESDVEDKLESEIDASAESTSDATNKNSSSTQEVKRETNNVADVLTAHESVNEDLASVNQHP